MPVAKTPQFVALKPVHGVGGFLNATDRNAMASGARWIARGGGPASAL
jgi:hypothetical protein